MIHHRSEKCGDYIKMVTSVDNENCTHCGATPEAQERMWSKMMSYCCNAAAQEHLANDLKKAEEYGREAGRKMAEKQAEFYADATVRVVDAVLEAVTPETMLEVRCPECKERFRLRWDETDVKDTIVINACQSGGVYGVKVVCPKCGHEEEIK